MKLTVLGFGLLLFGFGESPNLPTAVGPGSGGSLDLPARVGGPANESLAEQSLPGLNRKARRISRKSRRHTLGKTRGSAAKTRGAVKKRGRVYDKASRRGFDRANKRAAPKKKAGCKS